MKIRVAIAGLTAAMFGLSSGASLAAPCGPAVLSKVDGKVLVNRGVGFIDGTAGMPLAVGDHVMLRGGTAEILFVNGTGSALSGAKSMPITACSADGSRLTSPALAAAESSTAIAAAPATTTTAGLSTAGVIGVGVGVLAGAGLLISSSSDDANSSEGTAGNGTSNGGSNGNTPTMPDLPPIEPSPPVSPH